MLPRRRSNSSAHSQRPRVKIRGRPRADHELTRIVPVKQVAGLKAPGRVEGGRRQDRDYLEGEGQETRSLRLHRDRRSLGRYGIEAHSEAARRRSGTARGGVSRRFTEHRPAVLRQAQAQTHGDPSASRAKDAFRHGRRPREEPAASRAFGAAARSAATTQATVAPRAAAPTGRGAEPEDLRPRWRALTHRDQTENVKTGTPIAIRYRVESRSFRKGERRDMGGATRKGDRLRPRHFREEKSTV